MSNQIGKPNPSLDISSCEVFFDRNPFAFFITVAGRGIVRVNDSFKELTGYGTGDLEGRQIEDILSTRRPAELYDYHRAKLAHKDRPFVHECWLTRKDGVDVRVVMNMNIVTSEAYCLGALQDVSEERRLADELARRNLELRKNTDRLRAAQEELRRATELATLGEISGRVAHELLNPLTAVTAKIKRLTDENSTLGELCSFLDDCAKKMAEASSFQQEARTLQLVEQALDEHRASVSEALAFLGSELARIQGLVEGLRKTVKRPRDWSRIRLVDLLDYCKEVMADPIDKAGVSLELDCPGDIHVRGNRSELVQVVTNLLRNSVEALSTLPPGRPRAITLKACCRDGVAHIRVADTGPGIPEGKAPFIFEPTFSTKQTGTGLGLAIARRLARGHGGDLVFMAGGGPGCTFVLTLPCITGPSVAWEG